MAYGNHFFKKYIFGVVSVFSLTMSVTTASFAAVQQENVVCTRLSEQEVQSLFEQWSHAVKAKDLNAVLATYADDAVLLPTLSNTPRDTHAKIRAYFVKFFQKNPSPKINFQVIEMGCDWASNTGLYTFDLTVDGQRKSTQARYSYVYELINGKWLIVSHHSSLMPKKSVEGSL